MIRLRLSDQDARQLEDEYRQVKDTAYRDRLQIVRLASRDRPRPHQERRSPPTSASPPARSSGG